MEFSAYLHTLARQLRLEPTREQEIVQELESHLEEETAELEAQGMAHEEARRLAMRKMGNPKAVAQKLYEVHSPAVWRDILLATVPHFLLAAHGIRDVPMPVEQLDGLAAGVLDPDLIGPDKMVLGRRGLILEVDRLDRHPDRVGGLLIHGVLFRLLAGPPRRGSRAVGAILRPAGGLVQATA